ncbi:proline--tRNA ligase [Coprothermobacter platensis]|uniref:proline--tRNA ligase n=1 Tax=Coprothermobacter platensis TaxID=108819 RepID=UPI00037CD676|nr:proline--tRNA ligase [Coprothermobacter platensis]
MIAHAKNFFYKTLREDPKDAEAVSHKLLIRSSMIKQIASGIYAFLPLGHRVLKKIETIVREEMDGIGGQEMTMSIMMPAEMWKKTGRWDIYGDDMLKLKDRKEQDFCLGPTHEEQVTTLAGQVISSYKQLPLLVYQIQTKFRDEPRPRFGLIRLREFVMKDGYSFHDNEESLHETYMEVLKAYQRILGRMDLSFSVVAADPGQIGGNLSHEFIVPAKVGESTVFKCDKCGYVATSEVATSVAPALDTLEKPDQAKLHTPNSSSIDDVSQVLSLPKSRIVKAVMVIGDSKPYMILVRGDRNVDESKMNRRFSEWRMMTDEEITNMGLVPGFVGPKAHIEGLTILKDKSLDNVDWGVVGANEKDYHIVGVSLGDIPYDEIVDVGAVVEGDACPNCGGPLSSFTGLEVGHIFRLGTRYSEPLEAFYHDANGERKPFIMGCYGIGVTRLVSAIIEQHHDDNGIVWPWVVAPFHVVLIPIGTVQSSLDELSDSLVKAGLDVFVDDRDERPGVKFVDADLVGFPVRIVVNAKNTDQVEIKFRKTGEVVRVSRNEVVKTILDEAKNL